MSSPTFASASSPYPVSPPEAPGLLDRAGRSIALAVRRAVRSPARQAALAERALDAAARGPVPASPAWDERVALASAQLRRHGFRGIPLVDGLACAVRAAACAAGAPPSPAVAGAAAAMLGGAAVECPGREARELAMALAAAVAALGGRRVHVAVGSDAEAAAMLSRQRSLFSGVGVSASAVSQADAATQRRLAYLCDIVIVARRELALDVLRDALALRAHRGPLQLHAARVSGELAGGEHVMRGQDLLLVDDAGRALIDEARVPVALTRPVNRTRESAALREALAIARSMEAERDFALEDEYGVRFTAHGKSRAHAALERSATRGAPVAWDVLRMAVLAAHGLDPDRDYVLEGGSVVATSEALAIPAFAALWEGGLRQIVELAEGREPTPRTETLARSSFQRVVRRYAQLGAAGERLAEARGSLRAAYGLWPADASTPAGVDAERHVFANAQAKLDAVAALARGAAEAGLPVIAIVRSPAASERLAGRLATEGIACRAARPEAGEPARPAEPGEALLVALASPVPALEAWLRLCLPPGTGVCAIVADAPESERHARALRASLSAAWPEATLHERYALDDAALERHAYAALRALAGRFGADGRALPERVAAWLVGIATRAAESSWKRALLDARQAEAVQDGLAGFSGPRA